MKFVWKLLDLAPQPIMSALKRHTSPSLRLRVREMLGGSYRTIPDKIIDLRDGRRFHIGPDYIYWPLFMGRDFEPAATSIVRRLVRPGDVVVDAGANYGWYTTLLAELAGPAGRVYAFEPAPATFARLREHIALNGCEDRVVATRCAVGAARGEAEIHTFDNLSHSRSSLSPLDQSSFQTHAVAVTDLDSFLHAQNQFQIEFLKCDVEGSELMVLQGARRLLDSPRPPIALVELNHETSAAFGYQPTDIWKYLLNRGYDRFYEIEGENRIRRVDGEARISKVNLLLCGKGDHIAERLAGALPATAAA
jgi:FkbM family methyltransferase